MRTTTLTAVLLVLAAAAALSIPLVTASGGLAPVVGDDHAAAGQTAATASPQATMSNQADDNGTDDAESIRPGERLSGAIGAQGAEIDGELRERSFGIAVARSASDEEAADVVADRLADVETRLDDLDRRLEELRAAREAGEISHGQFAARVTRIEAERASLERQLDRANETADALPADVRRDRGIDAASIRTLRDRASELGGDEVSAIARSIAGGSVGAAIAAEKRPDDAGPPDGDTGPGGNDTERGGGDRGNGSEAGGSGSGERTDDSNSERGDDGRNSSNRGSGDWSAAVRDQ